MSVGLHTGTVDGGGPGGSRVYPSRRFRRCVVLDFDGDLFDHLAAQGLSTPWPSRACFHTSMRALTLDGAPVASCRAQSVVPAPCWLPSNCAAGARLIVGMTFAGRVSTNLPLPSIVIVDEAVRDEGTSLHYLPPSPTLCAPTTELLDALVRELSTIAAHVHRGRVWTADAPYRETAEQLQLWATQNVLAVEMQAASLFAFARARAARVAVVALVSNSVDAGTDGFDTGGNEFRTDVLAAIARAGLALLSPGE
jgi:hypothetical protein